MNLASFGIIFSIILSIFNPQSSTGGLKTIVLHANNQTKTILTASKTLSDALANEFDHKTIFENLDLQPFNNVEKYEVKMGRQNLIVISSIKPIVIKKTKNKKIKYKTINKNDSSLEKGKTKIAQEGRKGLQQETIYSLVIGNDIVKRIVYKKTLKKTKNKIVLIGTKVSNTEVGYATWYTAPAGKHTASGEIFNGNALTAAHRTLAFGTRVRITNLTNGKSVIVRINDRGPYSYHIIDLTYAAKQASGMSSVAKIKLTILN